MHFRHEKGSLEVGVLQTVIVQMIIVGTVNAKHDYLELFITSYECMSPRMFINNEN